MCFHKIRDISSTMDVPKLMLVMSLVLACSLSAFSSDGKAYGTECRTLLSSVRMEVSPALLQVICSNKNSTTLVVDCGSKIWHEAVAGFCSSFDLNMGHIFVNQPVLSTTITLQLVKSGEVLDAARVALLSSENVFHYRISVWGNRNTRFVIAITKECAPSLNDDVPGTLKNVHQTFTGKTFRHLPVVQVNSQSPQSIHRSGNNPPLSHAMDKDTPIIPEFKRQNKLGKKQQTNTNRLQSQYALMKMRNLQSHVKNASIEAEQTKVESYRSKFSKPDVEKNTTIPDFVPQSVWENNEEDAMTTTSESSEIAKLRWMEEKRLLFEQKMAFIRNFYPESPNSGHSDTEILSEEDVNEQTGVIVPQQSEELEDLPENLDPQNTPFEPYSSKGAFREHVNGLGLPPASQIYTGGYRRRSDNPRLLLNEDDASDKRPERLNFRRLDSSGVFTKAPYDRKSEVQPSNKSVMISDKSSVLPSTPAQEGVLKTIQENSQASLKTVPIKPGFTDFILSNSSFLNIIQQAAEDKSHSAVPTESFSNGGKSVQGGLILSESDAEIIPFSAIQLPPKTFNEQTALSNSTENTQNKNNLQTFSKTLFLTNVVQKQTNSRHMQNVAENIMKDTKQHPTFDELWTTLPTAVSTVKVEVTSKFLSVPQSSHNSKGINEESSTTTSTVPTATPLLIPGHDLNTFSKSIPYGINSATGDNHVGQSSQEINTEHILPLHSSLRKYMVMPLKESTESEANITTQNVSLITTTISLGESNKGVEYVSSTNSRLRTTIKSPNQQFVDFERAVDNISPIPARVELTATSSSTTLEKSEQDVAKFTSTDASFRTTIKSPSQLFVYFERAVDNNPPMRSRFDLTIKSPSMPLEESDKDITKYTSTDASFRTTIKSLNMTTAGHSDSLKTSPRSLSLSRSTPLPKKSIEPFIEARYFYSSDMKSSQLSPNSENIPGKKQYSQDTEITLTPQAKITQAPSLQTMTPKLIQMIQRVQTSVGPSLQASSNMHINKTIKPYAPVKRESHGGTQLLQEINTTNESHIQQSTTTPDPTQTNESMQLSMTSQDPKITGTPEANDDEQEDMERDSFWPIVAALVIGVPVVIVLGIAITVIYRKRKTDPVKLFHKKALKNSRNASVLTLQRESAVNRRQENIRSSRAETTRTIRQETDGSIQNQSVCTLTQDIPYPLSIDV